jgi:hypothetical protein
LKALLAIILLLPAIVWAETISVPKGHFLGISPPCASIANAREKALHDVASQILRTIGASYSVSFTSRATGTMEKVSWTFDERFHYSASGFLAEIETRIVSQEFERGSMGVVYRMLVYFPKQLISRMRQLSRGSKVLASKVGGGVYELREVNGVACVLTEAAYVVSERNRHANILNYYVMKVSSGGTQRYSKPLRAPVILRNNVAKRINLIVPNKNSVGDLVLGTRRSIQITLMGTDEVGRPVRVNVAD